MTRIVKLSEQNIGFCQLEGDVSVLNIGKSSFTPVAVIVCVLALRRPFLLQQKSTLEMSAKELFTMFNIDFQLIKSKVSHVTPTQINTSS